MSDPVPEAAQPITAALVLAADEPQQLAAFYAGLVDGLAVPGFSGSHWRVHLPAMGWLELYRPSRERPVVPGRGRLAICLKRQGDGPSLEGWMQHAIALGAQPLEEARQEPFGCEAWLLDPEGNGLLLLVSPS
ncbi:MAG: VOC family protein [Vulcanococcus sp.]